MTAIYILASGLLLAVAPGDNWDAEPPPVLAPPAVQPAIPPIPAQNASEPEPVLSPRAAAALVEDVRQLKEDAATLRDENRRLEERVAALEGPRPIPGGKAIETRLPATGTLVLDNRTLFAHAVSVNGLQYPITPGRTEIEIPLGKANVYLPYHEAPKQWGLDHWRRNGQKYEMLIVIGNQ